MKSAFGFAQRLAVKLTIVNTTKKTDDTNKKHKPRTEKLPNVRYRKEDLAQLDLKKLLDTVTNPEEKERLLKGRCERMRQLM